MLRKSVGLVVLVALAGGCQRHTSEGVARDEDAGGEVAPPSHVHAATPVEDAGVVLSQRNQGAMEAPGADAGTMHPVVPGGVVASDAGNAVEPLRDGGAAGQGVIGASPKTETGASAKAHVYVVRDTKMRCIVAPCMSLELLPVDSSEPTQKISDVDLSGANLTDEQKAAAMARVYSKAGLKAAGTVEDGPKGRGGVARVLKVEQVIGK